MSSERFAQVVQVLQQLGERCLAGALGGPAPEVSALLELQPAVELWFSSAAELAQLRQRAVQLLRYTKVEAAVLDDPIAVTMARLLEPQGRGRSVSADSLGLTTLEPLPVQLWPLVAVLAWRQPDFRLATARSIVGHLRSRQLISDGSTPCPTLDVRSFWVLLELAGMAQLRRLAAIDKPRDREGALLARAPRARRAVIKLSRIVEAAISGRRWAGFWDQWVLLEAARRNRTQLEHTTPGVLRLLAALPWLDELPQFPELQEPALRPQQPAEIARDDWRQELPAWLPGDTNPGRMHAEA